MELHSELVEMMKKAKPVRVIGFDPEEPEHALDGFYGFAQSTSGRKYLRKGCFEKGGRRLFDFYIGE